MTDLRPYFTQIIGHNSVNVHQIVPKLVQRSALMSPLSVPNFSPIRARIRVLWRILRSVRNEVEEKTEEIKTKFCSLVSQKWLERFSSNLVCGLPLLAGNCLANLVPSDKGSQSYIGVKIPFSFFLLIYSRVARRLLGPHDTLPCVLMYI